MAQLQLVVDLANACAGRLADHRLASDLLLRGNGFTDLPYSIATLVHELFPMDVILLCF